jgi:hypothetical protein
MVPYSASELQAFHQFVTNKPKIGGANMTLEDALEEWREHDPVPEVPDDDTAAIEEAIDEMIRGDTGRDAVEFIAVVRSKYGLPNQ